MTHHLYLLKSIYVKYALVMTAKLNVTLCEILVVKFSGSLRGTKVKGFSNVYGLVSNAVNTTFFVHVDLHP